MGDAISRRGSTVTIMSRWISLLVVFLLIGSQPALGGSYNDASGISFDYPDDGWSLFNAADLAQDAAVNDRLKKIAAEVGVSPQRMKVRLISDDQDAEINVVDVVGRTKIPMSSEDMVNELTIARKLLANVGARVQSVEGRIELIGTRPVLVCESRSEGPDSPLPIRVKSVVFLGRDNFITINVKAFED